MLRWLILILGMFTALFLFGYMLMTFVVASSYEVPGVAVSVAGMIAGIGLAFATIIAFRRMGAPLQ